MGPVTLKDKQTIASVVERVREESEGLDTDAFRSIVARGNPHILTVIIGLYTWKQLKQINWDKLKTVDGYSSLFLVVVCLYPTASVLELLKLWYTPRKKRPCLAFRVSTNKLSADHAALLCIQKHHGGDVLVKALRITGITDVEAIFDDLYAALDEENMAQVIKMCTSH